MRNLALALVLVLSLSLTGVFILLLLWWLLNRSRKKAPAPVEISLAVPDEAGEGAPSESATPSLDAEPEVGDTLADDTGEAREPAEPDDLTRIEGIGPKIAGVLQAAGVRTYAQLAETKVSRIEDLLEAESPRLRRLADPSTWPEQAALAACGEWEALEALQGTLQRGRRRG